MSKLIKNGQIYLFGTVMKDEWIWPEDTGYFSAAMVIEALAQFSGDVVLVVNSEGGMPTEGEAIRAAIDAHPGKVTAMITGAAHSAASLMVMGANQIEMSAGSLMLIHDPSAGRAGNSAELRAAADELDVMADGYAGVYAARAGITTDQAREIMRAETMFTAPEAVEAGFADAVTSGAAPAQADPVMQYNVARAAMDAAHGRVLAAQMKFEAKEAGLEAGESHNPNPGQEANETFGVQSMSKAKNTPAAGTVVAGAVAPAAVQAIPAPAAVDAAAVTMQATSDERARIKGIRDNAAPFMAHVGQARVDEMIDDGTTVAQANEIIMAAAAAGQPQTSRTTITRDETETKVQGMIGALMHRADPRNAKLEGPAMDYRGLRVKGLAMHLAGLRGGFNDIDTIRTGMNSTALMSGALGVSDFAYITTEVMNRTLQAAYARRAATWSLISRQRSASDFRALYSIKAGGDFQLKKVDGNGEYLQSTITDEAEGLTLVKYGRQINLTFEAIVNDDMGVFERLPSDFARAAGTLESRIAWGAIRDNKAMADGDALFHTNHKNKGAAGAIDVTTVGEGRAAMYEQKPAGSTEKDDFIAVTPDLLFVPPKLETVAGQFVAATTPTKMADANPFNTMRPVVEASLSAAAGGSDSIWYLFASDMPVLEHAYLDGYEAPTVTTLEKSNPDGVQMVARHIFAATPVEHRGGYRRG